jgi:hypothetical protein
MGSISGDSQVRAKADPLEPAHSFPMFADVLRRPAAQRSIAVEWKAAWREMFNRSAVFDALGTVTSYLVFRSWDSLLAAMASTRRPLLAP